MILRLKITLGEKYSGELRREKIKQDGVQIYEGPLSTSLGGFSGFRRRHMTSSGDLEGSEGGNEFSTTYFSSSVSLLFCCSLFYSVKFPVYMHTENKGKFSELECPIVFEGPKFELYERPLS